MYGAWQVDGTVGMHRLDALLYSLCDTEHVSGDACFCVLFVFFPAYEGFRREGHYLLTLLVQQGAPESLVSAGIARSWLGQPVSFIVINPGARRCNTPPSLRDA